MNNYGCHPNSICTPAGKFDVIGINRFVKMILIERIPSQEITLKTVEWMSRSGKRKSQKLQSCNFFFFTDQLCNIILDMKTRSYKVDEKADKECQLVEAVDKASKKYMETYGHPEAYVVYFLGGYFLANPKDFQITTYVDIYEMLGALICLNEKRVIRFKIRED